MNLPWQLLGVIRLLEWLYGQVVVGGGGLLLLRDWQTRLSKPRTLAKVKDDWSFYNLESLVSKVTVTTRNVKPADLS